MNAARIEQQRAVLALHMRAMRVAEDNRVSVRKAPL